MEQLLFALFTSPAAFPVCCVQHLTEHVELFPVTCYSISPRQHKPAVAAHSSGCNYVLTWRGDEKRKRTVDTECSPGKFHSFIRCLVLHRMVWAKWVCLFKVQKPFEPQRIPEMPEPWAPLPHGKEKKLSHPLLCSGRLLHPQKLQGLWPIFFKVRFSWN